MAIAAEAVGTVLAPLTVTIERGRLRFFAEAIGQTDPLYIDAEAARAAGYPDLPVPPTFLFGLALDAPDPFGWLTDLGIDLRFILHGTQKFDYDRLAFAGDTVDLHAEITNVFDKRGGALEFIDLQTRITQSGESIATLTQTVVVRHPELEAAR
jgi:acyl dehydratase